MSVFILSSLLTSLVLAHGKKLVILIAFIFFKKKIKHKRKRNKKTQTISPNINLFTFYEPKCNSSLLPYSLCKPKGKQDNTHK